MKGTIPDMVFGRSEVKIYIKKMKTFWRLRHHQSSSVDDWTDDGVDIIASSYLFDKISLHFASSEDYVRDITFNLERKWIQKVLPPSNIVFL